MEEDCGCGGDVQGVGQAEHRDFHLRILDIEKDKTKLREMRSICGKGFKLPFLNKPQCDVLLVHIDS